MSVECLQIRPGPRPLVHFTGEESHRMVFRAPRPPRRDAARRVAPGGQVCPLCCLPAPRAAEEGDCRTCPPPRPGRVPFLPDPRLRRLQNCMGRSVFSRLDSTSLVWKSSEVIIFFPKEFGFALV